MSNPAGSAPLFDLQSLSPALPLPVGETEESARNLFASIELEGAPKRELESYWREDWKRFVYTFGLTADVSGRSLEIGANPYFTTLLLHYFTELEPTLANYFGPQVGDRAQQKVTACNPKTGEAEERALHFYHFNRHELTQLLAYCGFEVEVAFTADVHHNAAGNFFSVDAIAPLVEFRSSDLGQYHFFRARNAGPTRHKRPTWLFRSYPAGELEE